MRSSRVFNFISIYTCLQSVSSLASAVAALVVGATNSEEGRCKQTVEALGALQVLTFFK